jgi:hypothetical protein
MRMRCGSQHSIGRQAGVSRRLPHIMKFASARIFWQRLLLQHYTVLGQVLSCHQASVAKSYRENPGLASGNKTKDRSLEHINVDVNSLFLLAIYLVMTSQSTERVGTWSGADDGGVDSRARPGPTRDDTAVEGHADNFPRTSVGSISHAAVAEGATAASHRESDASRPTDEEILLQQNIIRCYSRF